MQICMHLDFRLNSNLKYMFLFYKIFKLCIKVRLQHIRYDLLQMLISASQFFRKNGIFLSNFQILNRKIETLTSIDKKKLTGSLMSKNGFCNSDFRCFRIMYLFIYFLIPAKSKI